jgi:hypothetical protein
MAVALAKKPKSFQSGLRDVQLLYDGLVGNIGLQVLSSCRHVWKASWFLFCPHVWWRSECEYEIKLNLLNTVCRWDKRFLSRWLNFCALHLLQEGTQKNSVQGRKSSRADVCLLLGINNKWVYIYICIYICICISHTCMYITKIMLV